jgi:hypothetical protein
LRKGREKERGVQDSSGKPRRLLHGSSVSPKGYREDEAEKLMAQNLSKSAPHFSLFFLLTLI